MELGLTGRVVLVTGGSRGIGRAIALAFAAEGADVGICARDRVVLDRTAAELAEHGGRVLALSGDLRVSAECDRVVHEVAEHFGRLDVLVNNASASVDAMAGSLEELSDDDVGARFAGKALPAVWCTRAALPHLRASAAGRIVFIAGPSARTAGSGTATSGAAIAAGIGNAAVTNFAKSLEVSVVRDGILVNVVHPGFTKTERYGRRRAAKAAEFGISLEEADAVLSRSVPIGRLIESTDVAALVVFLASARASAITGQTIAVDGGASSTIVY